MKHITKGIMMMIVMLFTIACSKKANAPIDPEPDPEPDIEIPGALRSVKGAPIGQPTVKMIGPEGGEIGINNDIKITIPPGAVDKNIEFSIQEVTNTLAFPKGTSEQKDLKATKPTFPTKFPDSRLRNGSLSSIYRLLPENIEFKEDIEISMRYTKTSDYDQNKIKMTFQDSKGYWHVLKDITLSTNPDMIKAKTRHFSDWGIITDLYLRTDGKEFLDKGKTSDLKVYHLPTITKDDDLLAPEENLDNGFIKTWKIYPEGSLDYGDILGGPSSSATYLAPTSYSLKTPGVLRVNVTVYFNDASKTSLSTSYALLQEEYCHFVIGNVWNTAGEVALSVASGEKMIVDFYGRNDHRVHIEAEDQKFGSKLFGEKIWACLYTGGQYFASTYYDCNPIPIYSKGGIAVTDDENGLIQGQVLGEVGQKIGTYCYLPDFPLHINFRYRKKN
ncbi:hypothetical protein ACR78Z_24395 [Sphingobacterium thalpophilum]|uniref:hypothetical protein n=1 Tax=Sphingobacterium thalpophilum TaxID=259 RepID=UPI003DA3D5A9